MMKYIMKLATTLSLLLFIVCWREVDAAKRGGVKGVVAAPHKLRGLKKEQKQKNIKRDQKQMGNNKQMLKNNDIPQDRFIEPESGSVSDSFDGPSDELLICLSNTMEFNPLQAIGAFGMFTCLNSVLGFIIPRLWDLDNELERFTRVLTCVGDTVGCDGTNPNNNNNNNNNFGFVDVEPRQDETIGGFFGCLANGQQPGNGATVNFDVLNCVSLWDQTLSEIMTCIGESIGCEMDPPNNIVPLPFLPPGTDRNDDPNLVPEKIPIPLAQGWEEGIQEDKIAAKEEKRRHQTLGDLYDNP